MLNAVVNVASYLKPELLIDALGAPVTTKVNADWTKTARLLGGATTATPTITHKANGIYDISFTATAVGNWSVEYSVVVDGETVYFDPQFVQVIPAAADPAALATAIAGVAAMTDVATSTRAAAGTTVVSSSPTTSQGTVQITQGADYRTADGRSLPFVLTSAPDLTGATVTLLISWGVDSVSVTGTVANAGQATQTVSAELTAAQTALMPVTGTTYSLSAVLANTHHVPLKTGRVIVTPPTPAN